MEREPRSVGLASQTPLMPTCCAEQRRVCYRSVVLLQFAPQARRHGGAQRAESVNSGVRSWSHQSEGQGCTYGCRSCDPVPMDCAGRGRSLQQPPRGTDPCQSISTWARGIPVWSKQGALSSSSSWTRQVCITVPASSLGRSGGSTVFEWFRGRTLCLLGTISKCL